MARWTERQSDSIELDGFIQVRQDALLPESVVKADGKVIERHGSITVAGGTERQRSPIEIDGLIYVRQDASLPESDVKGHGKVGEKFGSIRVINGTLWQDRSTMLHEVDCHDIVAKMRSYTDS